MTDASIPVSAAGTSAALAPVTTSVEWCTR
jgi:hypothetical protein